MLDQNEPNCHMLNTNNENLCLPSHSNKQNKCQSLGASTSCATSHSEISCNKDLSACQLEGTHRRMTTFEFDRKSGTDSHFLDTPRISSCKEIYPMPNNAITPVYGFADRFDLSHLPASSGQCSHLSDSNNLYNPSNMFEPSLCPSDTFDLSAYSLVNDGQNLDLDDFSAIIDDLREDNFSLVDGLIDWIASAAVQPVSTDCNLLVQHTHTLLYCNATSINGIIHLKLYYCLVGCGH